MLQKGKVYCDFDGTLIKESIEPIWLKFLIKNKKLHWFQYFLAIISIPVGIIRKKQFKASLFKSWSVGMSREKKQKLIEEFCLTSAEEIHLNSKVLTKLEYLRNFYNIVILTGSDEDLVLNYLRYKKIECLFSNIIAAKMSKNGFFVQQHPYGKEKCKFIDTTSKTVGIANEFADSFFLKMCDRVFVVNGDVKLMALAKEEKWEEI